jgi:hypothetical protein
LPSQRYIKNQVEIDQPARVVRLEVNIGYYAEIISPTGQYNSTFIDGFSELAPIQEIYALSEIHCPDCNDLYDSLIKPKFKIGWPKLSRDAFAFKLWHKSVIWGCGASCKRCNESYFDIKSEKISAKC